MHRRIIAILTCLTFLSSSPGFAQDRDATSSDLSGIHKSSKKYFWAVAGGTAVGLGLGIIAPGGGKSAFKGALIGGSATSAFYLIKDPHAAGEHRAFAHLVTNTLLGTGIFWTVCNCSTGAWSGAFIGGGGTAIIQAFGTHNRSLAKMGGISQSTPDSTPAPGTEPGAATAPIVAGQQGAPAQPASPAPAQAPAAQPAPIQAQNSQVQTTAPVATQNPGVQPQSAPAAQTQNTPTATQGDPAAQSVPAQNQSVSPPVQSAPAATQNIPAQTQSVPASTQTEPAATQGTAAPNQNPPLVPEDLDFSSNSNSGSSLNIGSAALQPAPPRPQK